MQGTNVHHSTEKTITVFVVLVSIIFHASLVTGMALQWRCVIASQIYDLPGTQWTQIRWWTQINGSWNRIVVRCEQKISS